MGIACCRSLSGRRGLDWLLDWKYPVPTELPATRFLTFVADLGDESRALLCGPPIREIRKLRTPGKNTLSFDKTVTYRNRTLCPYYQIETELEVRDTLPCLFVSSSLRNIGKEKHLAYAFQDGRDAQWGSRELTGYTISGKNEVSIKDKGKHEIVTNGWAFLHVKGGPGYGLIVSDRACVWYDASKRPIVTAIPEKQSIKKGEALTVKYVIVNAETPAELEAIAKALSSEQKAAANVLVSNPLSCRLDATLSFKAPAGWSVKPANIPISLGPGDAIVQGFELSGPESPKSKHPAEVILTVPGIGKVRESGYIHH